MARNPRADFDWPEKHRLRERTNDFAYTLARIHWDTFNTLTLRNPVPHTKICYGMAWQWCRAISEVAGVPYNRLLIALRGEYGEKHGRFHFHCLIGGTTTRNTITLAHQSEALWRVISGNAIAESRPYDRSLAGAAYISKCLGANEYELNKYSSADSVTLSRSVLILIGDMARISERHCGDGQKKKRAGSENRGAISGLSLPAVSMICNKTAPASP